MGKHFLKVIIGYVCFFGFNPLSGQGIEEAIRFSTHGLGGSTRALGSANAIGAVGGSATSALVNPAGLALNRKSELHFGLNINSNGTQSTYINSPEQGDFNVGLGLSNLNLSVYSLSRGYDGKPLTTGLVNTVFSFGYNRHSDYRSSFTFTGNNTKSSFTDFLAEKANGTEAEFLNRYGLAHLAYETYLIEPKIASPDSFASGITSFNTNVQQTGVVERQGSGGDFNFSAAADFENTFYIGGGIIIRRQGFTENLQLIERDNQPLSDTNDYAGMTYTRFLKTKTSGIGLNIGALLKANENWRFGLAYSSPIRIKAKDSYTQSLSSAWDNNRGLRVPDPSYIRATPDDDFDGAPDTLKYQYRISTPSRFTMSAAYIFGKLGFISLDLERVNISRASLSPIDDTYFFTDENASISSNYKAVFNMRLGGELTYGKYRFRAGYSLYPSSFDNNTTSQLQQLNRSFYTLGLGYYESNYSLNAALMVTSSKVNYTPYALELGREFYSAEVKNSFVSVQFGATVVVD